MNRNKTNETLPEGAPPPAPASSKLPARVHVMCGWPLLLVLIGGAVGGALGGAAYGINLALYKSRLPVAVKIVLNCAAGLVAVVIWAAVAMAIHSGSR